MFSFLIVKPLSKICFIADTVMLFGLTSNFVDKSIVIKQFLLLSIELNLLNSD